ncbi:MAG: serine/threonine-protein kinase, partial [Myxococcota bacterium]
MSVIARSGADRRNTERYELRVRIGLSNPRTRSRKITDTRDVHVKGLFAHSVPEATRKGDELHVIFLDAPTRMPCIGTVQHLDAHGAGIALKKLAPSTKRFVNGLTTLERDLGGYHLTHHLGTGGMAQVYLAHAPDGETVVIKRLLPQYARESNAVELFTSEAELLSRCAHPSLPGFRSVTHSDDVFFLAMEWILGVPLDRLLDRVGRLPVEAARSVMLQLLRALEYLHALPMADGSSLSVHHGDISPQNIMVTPSGRMVLLDLGACSSELTPRPPGYEILGTLPYMAPEVLNGHEPHRASDLWSAGCLFYEMLTGERPFQGDNEFETVGQIAEG